MSSQGLFAGINRAVWPVEKVIRRGFYGFLNKKIISVCTLAISLVVLAGGGQSSKADVVPVGTYTAFATKGNDAKGVNVYQVSPNYTGIGQGFQATLDFPSITGKLTATAFLFNTVTESHSLTLSIWGGLDPAGTVPASLIESFTFNQSFIGTSDPTQAVAVARTTTNNVEIFSGYQYWISVESSADTDQTLRWALSTTANNGDTFFSNATKNNGTAWTNAANSNGTIFSGKVLASSLTVTVVPEPGTMALGGLAALGGVGGWWSRRKKRAVEAASA